MEDNSTSSPVDNTTAPDKHVFTGNGLNPQVLLAVNLIIAIATCFGCVIFLVAFLRYPRLRKQQNKMATALIINLIAVDLFHGAFALPWLIIPHYGLNLANFDRGACVLSLLLFQYSISVTFLNTLALSVERYVTIVHSFWEPPKCCRFGSKTKVVPAFIWLYPAVWAVTLTLPVTINKHWEECEQSMVLSVYHNAIPGIHMLIILITAPCLYGRIYCVVRKSTNKVRRFSENPSNDVTVSSSTPSSRSKIQPQEVRLVKTLVLLMALLYVCLLPMLLKIVLRILMGSPTPEPMWCHLMEQVCEIFLSLSPCLDPFVYIWRNREMRRLVWAMLRCRKIQDRSRTTGQSSSGQTMTSWASTNRMQERSLSQNSLSRI